MSVDFFIKGRGGHSSSPSLNMSNGNAASVLEFLGYYEFAMDLSGEIKARELKLRCKVALNMPDLAEVDKQLQPRTEQGTGGAWLINCGRREGYLTEKTEALLSLCEEAGDLGTVCLG